MGSSAARIPASSSEGLSRLRLGLVRLGFWVDESHVMAEEGAVGSSRVQSSVIWDDFMEERLEWRGTRQYSFSYGDCSSEAVSAEDALASEGPTKLDRTFVKCRLHLYCDE